VTQTDHLHAETGAVVVLKWFTGGDFGDGSRIRSFAVESFGIPVARFGAQMKLAFDGMHVKVDGILK
jgi:hypothetical protein